MALEVAARAHLDLGQALLHLAPHPEEALHREGIHECLDLLRGDFELPVRLVPVARDLGQELVGCHPGRGGQSGSRSRIAKRESPGRSPHPAPSRSLTSRKASSSERGSTSRVKRPKISRTFGATPRRRPRNAAARTIKLRAQSSMARKVGIAERHPKLPRFIVRGGQDARVSPAPPHRHRLAPPDPDRPASRSRRRSNPCRCAGSCAHHRIVLRGAPRKLADSRARHLSARGGTRRARPLYRSAATGSSSTKQAPVSPLAIDASDRPRERGPSAGTGPAPTPPPAWNGRRPGLTCERAGRVS